MNIASSFLFFLFPVFLAR